MRCRIAYFLVLSLVFPSGVFADFHYTETTKITGGSMLGMMRLAGTFSKQARQIGDPIVSSVYVQGNRMARNQPDTAEIIDLDKETVTHIDHQKKQYYTITFQQMKEQIEEAQREAAKHPQEKAAPPPKSDAPSTTDMKFDVAVRNTGATQEFSGLDTKEAILTLTMQATDQKTGESGNLAMTNDLWMTQEIPGYQEVRDFNLRYAKKLGDVYGSITAPMVASMRSQMKPGSVEGMGEMAKEVSKLKGIPLYTVMRMGSTLDGKPLPAASEAPLPAENQEANMPSKTDIAKQSATNATTSAIANKLGGFGSAIGGFGRKKKQEQPPPPTQAADVQPSSMVLMETTTEMGGFSSQRLDGSQFRPPAGYQQVPIPEHRTHTAN
ncbi:MAG TPA: hypothetical protein VM578_12840 [Candidatus Saccharimonadales bacterium]|nr:hypothetical protein [Candidatus Saccharimonadales bacterium]